MPINRKTSPEEALKPREMSQIQDGKRTTNKEQFILKNKLELIRGNIDTENYVT